MKNVKIVVGANFGDEGKGLMTDYFSSSESANSIVIRFNGGAQAGHTVVTPDGKRHVFSHFGSGTFNKVPTYLSEYFICNPTLYKKEFLELKECDINPLVYFAHNCMISNPFDMLINQIVESNTTSKNGSCGVGINETIERYKVMPFRHTDIHSTSYMKHYLNQIKGEYIHKRLESYGITNIPLQYLEPLLSNSVINNYLEDLEFFLNHAYISNKTEMLNQWDNLIFEGAQGLLLDKNSVYYPNVTPTNTGIKNALRLIRHSIPHIDDLEICYVSRHYVTKHGKGYFPLQLNQKPNAHVEDLTNVPNEFQGKLRYGSLNINELNRHIKEDLSNFGKNISTKYTVSLAMTCLDQSNGYIDYYYNDNHFATNIGKFIDKLKKSIAMNDIYMSYGATRDDIISEQVIL